MLDPSAMSSSTSANDRLQRRTAPLRQPKARGEKKGLGGDTDGTSADLNNNNEGDGKNVPFGPRGSGGGGARGRGRGGGGRGRGGGGVVPRAHLKPSKSANLRLGGRCADLAASEAEASAGASGDGGGGGVGAGPRRRASVGSLVGGGGGERTRAGNLAYR